MLFSHFRWRRLWGWFWNRAFGESARTKTTGRSNGNTQHQASWNDVCWRWTFANFDVTVNDRVMMERNRVNIQRLIRAVMDQFSCAFMLFHYEDDTRWDWRFTYCRKSGNKEETTDSKRYTFLLGPGQSCRTATDNFMALYDKGILLKLKTSKMHSTLKLFLKSSSGSTRLNMKILSITWLPLPTECVSTSLIQTLTIRVWQPTKFVTVRKNPFVIM